MFKFFRKIRQKLLSEGSLRKYLLYAFGEIVLVVIGILIALQINNWNQQKKDLAQVKSICMQIQTSLANEILDCTEATEFYFKRDSVLNLIIYGRLKAGDYNRTLIHSPRFAILNGKELEVNRVAYNNLAAIGDKIPPTYDSIYQDLMDLYEVRAPKLLDRIESLDNRTSEFRDHLKQNFDWYYKINFHGFNEEAFSYFLENPMYRNHVEDYMISAKQLWGAIIKYKGEAIQVYRELCSLTNSAPDPRIQPYLLAEETSQAYVGTYGSGVLSKPFQVYFENDQLYCVVHDGTKIELIPQEEDTFVEAGRILFFIFKKEENGEISQLDLMDSRRDIGLSLAKNSE